ncbi:MAG: DUF559 domain-containing protein [Anaerolineales bacterium]
MYRLIGDCFATNARNDIETKYLEAGGYRVLRFWNHDVMNHVEIVLKVIWTTETQSQSGIGKIEKQAGEAMCLAR